jgi:hypothetical protein
LIADMQCLGATDAAKIPLTGTHTPGLVADVDEDIAATWENGFNITDEK